MNKFWIVLSHTYISKVRTKSFLISTGIMLLLILGLSNLPKILDFFDKGEVPSVAVVDETNELFPAFRELAEDEFLSLAEAESEAEAASMTEKGEQTAYLVISEKDGSLQGVYKADSISDTELSGKLSAALNILQQRRTAEKLDLGDEQIQALNQPALFNAVALDEGAKTEEDLNQARGLVYVLLFVNYFVVVMYASMIAMEVATEKSSRVMEILISSVPPIQQMFAKILGIGLVSITQMLLFLGAGYFSVKQNITDLEEGFFSVFGFGSLNLSTVIYAVVFVFLGYLLYAAMAACLGSVVSRIEDVQQMIMPMTLLIVAAFMIAMTGLGNPEAGYVTVTSFIPFFSPMIMFLRVGMLDIPVWQVIVSIAILVLSIVLISLFAARVYRGGVLMYGSSKSWKDLKKALQMSRK